MTESKVETMIQSAKPRKHAVIFLKGRKLVWSVSNCIDGGMHFEGVSEGAESCTVKGERDERRCNLII